MSADAPTGPDTLAGTAHGVTWRSPAGPSAICIKPTGDGDGGMVLTLMVAGVQASVPLDAYHALHVWQCVAGAITGHRSFEVD